MTEAAFREAMVAQMASLTSSVEMLKIEMREAAAAQWDRIVDRFDAQKEATGIALTASEKAVVKAEVLATARSSQQDDRISDLSVRADKGTGRGEGSKATLYGAGFAIATVVAVVSIIIQMTH